MPKYHLKTPSRGHDHTFAVTDTEAELIPFIKSVLSDPLNKHKTFEDFYVSIEPDNQKGDWITTSLNCFVLKQLILKQ